MRVLVCGGRDFKDWELLHAELDNLKPPATRIIHGGARGADTLAGEWARSRNIPTTVVRAESIRNKHMLLHKPNLVIAFPGGAGTADMVRRAKAAGIPVMEVSHESDPN